MSTSSPDSSTPAPDASDPAGPGAGTPRRVLVVMRHGKAEPFAEDDHGRQLTERGARDSVEAGEWLRHEGLLPTHALVSSAARTRATWGSVREGGDLRSEVRVEDAVYGADTDSAIDVLRTVAEDAEVVLYVGHNPTAASLVHQLDDGDPDMDAFVGLSGGFPTSAVAVLEVAVPWADLGTATARLVDFHVGQG